MDHVGHDTGPHYQSPKLEFVVNRMLVSSENELPRDLPGAQRVSSATTWRVGGGRRVTRPTGATAALQDRRAAAEVHRAAVGVEVGLRNPLPHLGAARRERGVSRKGTATWTGPGSSTKSRIWPRFMPGRVREEGALCHHVPDDYKSTPAFRWFNEGRECDTPDLRNPKVDVEGKELRPTAEIEFVSRPEQALPDDDERPPMPHYIPSWEGTVGAFQEVPASSSSRPTASLIPTHYATHLVDERDPGSPIQKDGYDWWPLRIHPSDAAFRHIQNGDIVKIYNDRARCSALAVLTGRVEARLVSQLRFSPSTTRWSPGNRLHRPGRVRQPASPLRGCSRRTRRG